MLILLEGPKKLSSLWGRGAQRPAPPTHSHIPFFLGVSVLSNQLCLAWGVCVWGCGQRGGLDQPGLPPSLQALSWEALQDSGRAEPLGPWDPRPPLSLRRIPSPEVSDIPILCCGRPESPRIAGRAWSQAALSVPGAGMRLQPPEGCNYPFSSLSLFNTFFFFWYKLQADLSARITHYCIRGGMTRS